MNDELKEALLKFLLMIMDMVIVILLIFLKFSILKDFWNWFLVPAFDMKVITSVHAFGLFAFLRILVGLPDPKDLKPTPSKTLVIHLIFLLSTWSIAYILR